jgi:hypothetical protein
MILREAGIEGPNVGLFKAEWVEILERHIRTPEVGRNVLMARTGNR